MKSAKLAIFATLLTMASTTFAATSAANTNTVAPTMLVKVNVQKAVSLTLVTGTSAIASHCTPTATGSPDYTMDFGTVDALAISTPTCGMKFAPATPGTSNAVYWTDYNLVPVYTSQGALTGPTITAQVTGNTFQSNVSIVRDTANSATVPAGVGSFSAMGVATADTIASGNAAIPGTGLAITRFIGVSIAPGNGAGLAGAQQATVTFTLTAQ